VTDFERAAQEIRDALQIDETRMGDVYRGLAAGKSPTTIASELGTQTPNFVNKYKRFARAIETGDLPSAPTMIRECGTAARGFLNRHYDRFSPETIRILEERIAALNNIRIDPVAEENEDLRIRHRTQRAERQAIPGIYVYTLPHYRKHPVEPATDESLAHRTLMKVGMSDSDVIRRFRNQERNTSLPEDPELLRIYTGETEMLPLEQRIHRLLRAADHRQNSGRASGTEWFLTSLKFLDAIAEDLGLKTFLSIDDAIEEENE
jgi:T5orf172 domain